MSGVKERSRPTAKAGPQKTNDLPAIIARNGDIRLIGSTVETQLAMVLDGLCSGGVKLTELTPSLALIWSHGYTQGELSAGVYAVDVLHAKVDRLEAECARLNVENDRLADLVYRAVV